MTAILGHLWALPTSLLGLVLALVGGARPVRLEGPERAWVWHVEGGLLGWLFGAWTFQIGAQTIGGLILIRPDCDPLLLVHERCHVRQGFILGALYLPVYLVSWALAGFSYADNWMERRARKAAGDPMMEANDRNDGAAPAPAFVLTGEQLARIMPHASAARLALYFEPLTAGMQEWAITTAARAAAFLAQLAHESCELLYMEEIASGAAYEGRADLGNIHPGDGRHYKGRGPIQLTGRANYHAAGEALHLPLEAQPELAATPAVGFRVAGWFWSTHGLNDLADQGDFKAITRRINGGLNGERQREAFYARACEVLGVTTPEIP